MTYIIEPQISRRYPTFFFAISTAVADYLRKVLEAFLSSITDIVSWYPRCLEKQLSRYQLEQLQTIRLLFQQQQEMYKERKHRIVSLSQHWIHPIV